MSILKPSDLILNNVTVATNNYQETPNGVDLSQAIDLGIGYELTFNAASTAGARIEMYADKSGLLQNFTIGNNSSTIETWNIPVSANQTVDGVLQAPHFPKYAKFRVVNLDTGQTITACSLWAQKQIA